MYANISMCITIEQKGIEDVIAKHPEQLTRVDILNLSTALLDSRTYLNMLINISPRVVTKLRLCGLSIVTVRPRAVILKFIRQHQSPLTGAISRRETSGLEPRGACRPDRCGHSSFAHSMSNRGSTQPLLSLEQRARGVYLSKCLRERPWILDGTWRP